MIELKQISLSEAQRAYNTLRVGDSVDWASIEMPVIPKHITKKTADIEALQKALTTLKHKFPLALSARSTEGTSFDAKAAILIHKSLQIDDFVAGRPEFWAWLSLKHFWGLVNWRHRGSKDEAIPENFSVTKRRHGLLERLWFRAEIGKVPGKDDPYGYVSSATDRDFWESGIIRTSYSSCRELAQAFIRYQFQVEGGYLHLTDPDGVRELYKRLKRIYATVSLDLLEEEQAYELVSDLGDGLTKSKYAKRAIGTRK